MNRLLRGRKTWRSVKRPAVRHGTQAERWREVAFVAIVLGACSRPAARPAPPAPPRPIASDLTGGRIAATARGAVVSDADTGELYALDPTGAMTAHVTLHGPRAVVGDGGGWAARVAPGRGAGQLVVDPVRDVTFVADRSSDRVVVVDAALHVVAGWHTPAEPFGLALTADRKTLLVTTIADRVLVALDAETGTERWRATISAGARGVSAGGHVAIVGSIATNTVEVVELDGEHRVASIPLQLACERCDASDAVARGTGSVRFLDRDHAVATYQRSIPSALFEHRVEVYGGGAKPPVTQHVAFFTFSDTGAGEIVAQLVENQPRALAWDAARDTLYVAGLGSDTLLALHSIGSRDPAAIAATATNAVMRASERCGPDGLALAADGGLWIWCSFARRVLRFDPGTQQLVESEQLAASAYTTSQHDGLVLFYTTNPAVNRDHALACATCHLEALTDGLSWKIGSQALQTPVLAGRLAGTAPYRWDGSAPTLAASIASTVHRLGGEGLSAKQSEALVAYLEALPRPRPPTLDPAAVARGAVVFAGAGCDHCHAGAAFTDGQRHQLESTLASADTPSLIGLASSAPYFHDGSAATLAELVRGGGGVHGMADFSRLTDSARTDLVAFLESL